MDSRVQTRLDRFKNDITTVPVGSMVRRHMTFGNCYILEEDRYFDLKIEVADHFKIHPSEVLMVGSGKLGFSIVSSKRYRPFGDTSDIDLAIISPALFDIIWHNVYDYSFSGGYWPDEKSFKEYLFRGWIRPDKLPPSHKFTLCKDWWDFFRSLASRGNYGPYKISAGLYRNWHFLETYLGVCINECVLDLEINK